MDDTHAPTSAAIATLRPSAFRVVERDPITGRHRYNFGTLAVGQHLGVQYLPDRPRFAQHLEVVSCARHWQRRHPSRSAVRFQILLGAAYIYVTRIS